MLPSAYFTPSDTLFAHAVYKVRFNDNFSHHNVLLPLFIFQALVDRRVDHRPLAQKHVQECCGNAERVCVRGRVFDKEMRRASESGTSRRLRCSISEDEVFHIKNEIAIRHFHHY